MRIIGGRFKGLSLTSVGRGDQAAHLRPTTDRVRESLFGVLQGGRFGSPLHEARVLDLFAGTGALGLEALSRGAQHVTFVENGRVALKLLKANIDKAGVAEETKVLRQDATRLPKAEAAATLIFLDPPYGSEKGEASLRSAQQAGWIAKDALIVLEDAVEGRPPDGFQKVEARRFGQTWLTFLRLRDK